MSRRGMGLCARCPGRLHGAAECPQIPCLEDAAAWAIGRAHAEAERSARGQPPFRREIVVRPLGTHEADATAPEGPYRLVAPAGCLDLPASAPPRPAHEGRAARRPHEYRVAATLAHLNTPELVPLVADLLRLQRERPYLIVVDTGSTPRACEALEAMRAEDLEVHFLRAGGYTHSSEPVALACDLAQARCKSEYLLYTHCDCFLRRREVVGDLLARCGPPGEPGKAPIVGYALTDRSIVTDAWRWMVGHTLTMAHLPTLRRANVWWGVDWDRDTGARPDSELGYYDTEIAWNWAARKAGLEIRQVGELERNHARNVNDDFDHPRSWATSKLYRIGDEAYRSGKDAWMRDAMAEARARIAAWRRRDAKPRVALGDPQQRK